MSALPVVLPVLQARAELHLVCPPARPSMLPVVQASSPPLPEPCTTPRPQFAFYRKYTEALLRRYVRMSLQVGRVPSVLGRGELFRAKASNYGMESFEDLVIFCHDIERCLQRLTANEQLLIETMAIKEYSSLEAEPVLHLCRQTIVRNYTRALDRLTLIFLETEILKLQKSCQVPQPVGNSPVASN